ncbi:MAG TPA: SDR family NAD(P)-dependent oxidoreductase, partial [Gammaproteobacteria bacterium]|nr:SDR family NAD(P)-dependent oxidoreductase [Gammaproteobacteria bacterium]
MPAKQKTAVVTGANKGLGREICRQLLADGFRVILTARDESNGRAASERLATDYPDIEFFAVDVTVQSDVDALRHYLDDRYQRCDVLVNNAGIFPDPRHDLDNPWPSILTANIDTIRLGLETNTYGALRLCQALIPLMQANQYGRIVNMSSGMGQLSDMNGCCPGYRISKTALNVITRVLADELQDTDILIN